MKTLVGITLIVILILIGQRKSFVRFKVLYVTGTEFLLFGFLLGDSFIGLLDPDTLRALVPVIGLGLGWVGFLYGLQLELRTLRRFPVDYFLASMLQALLTLVVVAAPAYVLLARFGVDRTTAGITAAVLAATASCSAPTVIALMSRNPRVRRLRAMKALRYLTGLGDLPAVLLVGIAFCVFHPYSLVGIGSFVAAQWLLVSIVLGAFFGLLFVYFLRYVRNEEELLVVILGTVFLSAGAATYLNLSPLFVNLIAGLAVVNVSGHQRRITELIHHPERTIYLTFLVVAGASLQLSSIWAVILAGVYIIVRLLGKTLGGYLGARLILKDRSVTSHLGMGLIAQGGMSVAIIVNYQMIVDSFLSEIIVSGVVLAIVFTELLSPTLIRRVLRAEEGA
jgi:Kef-type K+ transport system membrane component KefB